MAREAQAGVRELQRKLSNNAAHTCMRTMSSIGCLGCDRLIPYHHLTPMDTIADFGRRKIDSVSDSKFQKAAQRAKLIPVDMKRCQAETKEPVNPFGVGHPPSQWERCKKEPRWVAMEPRENGKSDRGAMSLCGVCRKAFLERYEVSEGDPRTAQVVKIELFEAAHRTGGDDAVWAVVDSHP